MKKLVLITTALFLCTFVYADITVFPNIQVRNASQFGLYQRENFLLNQNPDPAEPGRYVEVRFKVENIGMADANNVVFELLPEYPFYLDPGATGQLRLGDVAARQVGDDAYVLYYKLRVDKNAVEGKNQIRIRYSTDNGASWKMLDPFYIRVKSHNPILSVESVESSPEVIEPGKKAKLKIKIKNMANSFLKNIKLKLELVRVAVTASSVSYTEIPFTPVGSSNEKVVDFLDSGREKTLTFELIASPDASTGVYKIPLRVSYQDMLGTNYSTTSIIGLVLRSSPEIAATVYKSDILHPKSSGTVEVRFINKGLSEIKFLNVVLSKTDDYDILSTDEVYIGNIDSDDYESADFKLFIKSNKREIALPMTVEYKDSSNIDYKEKLTPVLKLYTEEEAKRAGLRKSNRIIGIAIVITIVVGGLLIYKWRRRRKRHVK